MNEAEKKFRNSAVAAIFVLLTVLLGIMNAVNFTLAARDADHVTQTIRERNGVLEDKPAMPLPPDGAGKGLGPMGPDSPEMNASLRYFTVSFDKEGNARLIAYSISAVSEEEAVSWAESLAKEKTGWSRGTYRYRVYKEDGVKYVIVIDQGREMISAYRMLIYSGVGIAAVVVLSWIFLRIVGKKLFAPIDEADRRQKQFIANAEKEFKLPLTVISADTEILERENGPSDQTASIRRQVRKMDDLVRRLGSLTVYEETKMEKTRFSLSELMQETLDRNADRFDRRGIRLDRQIAENVLFVGEPEAFSQVMKELVENALKYSQDEAKFTLSGENGRIRLSASNGCSLPDGSVQQAFDRFTTLGNADAEETGLGLAYVKDIVLAHNGRCYAEVKDGRFEVRLEL